MANIETAANAAYTGRNLSRGLYKLYTGENRNDKDRMERIGGMTTGVLVVPFKLRSSDTFSGDATIGPYWGFKRNFLTLVATCGLTQVSMGTGEDAGDKRVESKTGLTYGGGIIFKVSKAFDIALIVGRDTVFGSDKDEFEHQGKTWYSFGIGYNFTK